eukprot:1352879-Rhodomonas_salina.2
MRLRRFPSLHPTRQAQAQEFKLLGYGGSSGSSSAANAAGSPTRARFRVSESANVARRVAGAGIAGKAQTTRSE